MQVEVFEVDEVMSDGTTDDMDEVRRLSEELGLEGQQELVTGDVDRFPYRVMTKEEVTVYEALFPRRTNWGEGRELERGAVPARTMG